MYKQGGIIVVRFPFTDGSEFKKRPALVVYNETVNKTGDFLIVQITSKLIQDGLSIIINDKDILQPLPLQSYIRTHKIFTINKDLIITKVTSMQPDSLDKITTKICSLLNSTHQISE